MNAKLILDKSGRIVLPKRLRDELKLQAGDALEVKCSGVEIRLRPLRGKAVLRKKRGVWVFRAGDPLTQETVDKTVRAVRRERTIRLFLSARPAKERRRPDFMARLKKTYRGKSRKISGAELVSSDRNRH